MLGGGQVSANGKISVDASTGEVWLEEAYGFSSSHPWSDDGYFLDGVSIEAVDECGASTTIGVTYSVYRNIWDIREADVSPTDGGITEDPWCNCTQPVGGTEGNPHPIMHFDVDVLYDAPAYYEVTLTVDNGSVTLPVATAQQFQVSSGMAGTTARMAFQFDASELGTGFHDYSIEVTARSSGGGLIGTKSLEGRVAVVNRREDSTTLPSRDGEYGNRRWLEFLDRLDLDEATTGGVGLIRGDGTYEFFSGTGGTYASPIDVFETLTRTTDGLGATIYLLESPDGWTKLFNAAGLLQQTTDRNGRVLEDFDYDEHDGDGLYDELVSYTQADGHVATYTYTNGRLSSSSDGRGQTFSYVYNSNGTLQETSALPAHSGGSTPTISYTYYSGTKLLHTKTDIRGLITTFTYGSDLRIRSIDRPDSGLETIDPSQIHGLNTLVPVEEVEFETTIGGETWARQIDSLGNVRYEVDANGNIVEYVRDNRGLVRQIIQANPNDVNNPLVTRFEYNSRGKVTKVVYPDATSRLYEYAANGLDLLSEVDERGQTWTYTVDSRGNRLTATDPLGNTMTYGYDSVTGNLETVTLPDPDGNQGQQQASVTTYQYDAHHRVELVTYADQTTRSITYDSVTGNVASETDELGHTTSYTYDTFGRVHTVTLPDPDVLKDEDGDGIYDNDTPVWTYIWCACGSLKTVTDPLGNITTYDYDDTTGLLESVTTADPDGTSSGLPPLVTSYEYDTFGRLWKEIAPGNRVTTYEYDGNGNLWKVTQPDPDGNPLSGDPAPVWEFGYDALNRLSWADDPLDHRTTYTYSPVGDLVSVTDPTGYVTEYEYLEDGLPEVLRDAQKVASLLPSSETILEYDIAGRLKTSTDPLGFVTSYQFDNAGRLESVTAPDPDGDNGGTTVSYTGFRGDSVTGNFGLDGDQPVVGDWNGDGLDEIGVFRSGAWWYLDANADGTFTTGDQIANFGLSDDIPVVGRWTASATKDQIGVFRDGDFYLDASGDGVWGAGDIYLEDAAVAGVLPIIGDWDGDGVDNIGIHFGITFELDTNNNGVLDPNDDSFQLGYTTDQPIVGDWNGDGADEVGLVRDFSTGQRLWILDANGSQTADSNDLQILYGANGATPIVGRWLADAAFGIGTHVDYVWTRESYGKLNVDQSAPVTTYEYDEVGQLISETNSRGGTTSYDYDAAGNLLSLTDALGNTTSWIYDALGRMTSETNELNETRTYEYDALGNLTRATDRLDRIVEYAYDNLSRVTSETWFAAGGATVVNTISYVYDAWGRLDIVEDAYSKYDFGYDNLDRLTSIDNLGNATLVPRTVLTNTYDLAGRRTSLAATNPSDSAKNDFVNAYSYDDAGRMTRVTQAGQSGGRGVAEKRVDFTYDDFGRFDVLTRFADLAGGELVATTDYGYDAAGRLTGLSHFKGATTFAAYAYGYDALSRLTSATIPKPGGSDDFEYVYDETDQLRAVLKNGVADESYAYDPNGNRTSDGSATGANNQLLENAEYTFEYDDEGNRTKRTKKSDGGYTVYSYDHRNRLTDVSDYTAGGVRTQHVVYRYDAFDRRLRRYFDADGNASGAGVVETYVYDSAPGKGGLDDLVLTFDGSGNVKHRYLHGPAVDQVFADENALNEVLWSLADRQGSVRDWVEYDEATDTTSVANHVEFDAYGQILSQTPGFEVFYAYTGRTYDAATDLYDYRTRVYDASTGRFISEDWIGFNGGQAVLSGYVGNSPTNYTDPSGMQAYIYPFNTPGGAGFRPPQSEINYTELRAATASVNGTATAVKGMLTFGRFTGPIEVIPATPRMRSDPIYALECTILGGIGGAALGAGTGPLPRIPKGPSSVRCLPGTNPRALLMSFDDILANPKSLYGKSADEVAEILGDGWNQGHYGVTGTGWKFTKGDKIVFYHEGGRHIGPYYGYSSGATGKVKITGPGYKPLPGDKATIIPVE